MTTTLVSTICSNQAKIGEFVLHVEFIVHGTAEFDEDSTEYNGGYSFSCDEIWDSQEEVIYSRTHGIDRRAEVAKAYGILSMDLASFNRAIQSKFMEEKA